MILIMSVFNIMLVIYEVIKSKKKKRTFTLLEGIGMSRVCIKNKVLLEKCLLDHFENIKDILQWVFVGKPLIKYCAFHFFNYVITVVNSTDFICKHVVYTGIQYFLLNSLFYCKQCINAWRQILHATNKVMGVWVKSDLLQSLNSLWAIQSSKGYIVQSVEYSRMTLSKNYCNHIFFSYILALG